MNVNFPLNNKAFDVKKQVKMFVFPGCLIVQSEPPFGLNVMTESNFTLVYDRKQFYTGNIRNKTVLIEITDRQSSGFWIDRYIRNVGQPVRVKIIRVHCFPL